MKTLVTGGTGFIGTHLVKALVERGREVRCLVRRSSDTSELKKLGAELFYGDLLDKDSLIGAVKEIRIVYHLAGEVYSKRKSDYYKVNVFGTKKLLEACLKAKIEKFIYLSSIAAVGPNLNKEVLLNEKSPYKPVTAYGRSKKEAEDLVLECINDHKFPGIIMLLPMIYGPKAVKCRSSILFRMIQRKRFIFIGKGSNKISMCYIDNLIQGLLLAETNEQSIGKTYFIADEEIYSLSHIAQFIAKEEKVNLPKIHIPFWIANIVAVILQIMNIIFKLPFFFSKDMVKEITSNWACDISLIKKELNYTPKINFEEGAKRTVQWLRCFEQ
jgi:nucleoside-diphosphate-sugar epimerase